MPSARAVNTVIATVADWVMANPSAAPMNGAVQGVATSVAITPDKKASAYPDCARTEPASCCTRAPSSNTPDMFSASTKNNNASPDTTSGDCNW